MVLVGDLDSLGGLPSYSQVVGDDHADGLAAVVNVPGRKNLLGSVEERPGKKRLTLRCCKNAKSCHVHNFFFPETCARMNLENEQIFKS